MRCRIVRRSLVALCSLLVPLGPAALAAPMEFSDGDFTTDWQYTQLTTGNGGSFTVSPGSPGDGNPGASLVTTTSVAANCAAIYGFGFKTSAVYDPSAQGAIDSLDYSEDAKLINGFGGGQAYGPAIRQDGKVYRILGLGTGAIFSWQTYSLTNLHAAQFVQILGGACGFDADPSSHPDFSAAGGPMEFGFVRANSQINGHPTYTITGAIDNWKVTVYTLYYAALGDSFSAGEGLGSYLAGTANPYFPRNECHRSTKAYGFQVDFPHVRLDAQNFLACSGARIVNVLSNPPGRSPEAAPLEAPQLDRTRDNVLIVGDDTSMVSLTTGGNDLGFSEILTKCFLNDCDSASYHPFLFDNRSLKQVVDARLALIANNAAAVYQTIRNRTPNGAVFALGYPHLFGTGTCPDAMAPWSTSEKLWLDQLSDRLTATLRSAAAAAGVHFIAVSFQGHEICTTSPWINKWTLGFSGSFHPKAAGHVRYANSLTRYMHDRVILGDPVLPTGIPRNPDPVGPLALDSTLVPGDAPVPSFGALFVTPATAPPCGLGDRFVAGQQVRIEGGGFGAGAGVTVYLEVVGYSAQIATTSASGAGDIDVVATLPAGLPANQPAALEAQGLGVDGESRLLLVELDLSTSFTDDVDEDGVPDPCDNCPQLADPNVDDSDGDSIGDACDDCPFDEENDMDSDGICAQVDACPWDPANDLDFDGVCESFDNCTYNFNPSQLDSDSDGAGDACDGAPIDPGAFELPHEIRELAFDADHQTLRWMSAVPSAGLLTVHDVVRGAVDLLPVGSGEICLAAGLSTDHATDTGQPPPGGCFFYLVRGRNSIATGTYGQQSDGADRVTGACP